MPLLNCLSCHQPYEEQDDDPYYCLPCLVNKKQRAAEIDKKRSLNPSTKTKSDLEIYDELQKKTGSKFVNYKYLIH